MAAFVLAQREAPAKAERFRRLKAQGPGDHSDGIRYVRSQRHDLEVEYFSYRQRLQRLVKKLGSPRVRTTA